MNPNINLNISSEAFITAARAIRGQARNHPLQVNVNAGGDGVNTIEVIQALQADHTAMREIVSHFRNTLTATYGEHIANFALRDPATDSLIEHSLTAHAIEGAFEVADGLRGQAEQIKQNIVRFNHLRDRAYQEGFLTTFHQPIQTEDIENDLVLLIKRAEEFSQAELTFTEELNNKIQNWIRTSEASSSSCYNRSSIALTLLKDTTDLSIKIIRFSTRISIQASAYYDLANGMRVPFERQLANIGQNHNIAVRSRNTATLSFEGHFGTNRPLPSLEEEEGASTPSTRSNSDEEKAAHK